MCLYSKVSCSRDGRLHLGTALAAAASHLVGELPSRQLLALDGRLEQPADLCLHRAAVAPLEDAQLLRVARAHEEERVADEAQHALAEHRLDRRLPAVLAPAKVLDESRAAVGGRAAELGELVVVSILVNPTQFNDAQDFESYPRTLETDAALAQSAGAHAVFAPQPEDLYGGKPEAQRVDWGNLTNAFEGAHRPGHFDGVVAVVDLLFDAVKPSFAVFGEKDLQQLLIIKKMVSDLSLPIDIQSGATQRAEDGLALSSRNQYLSASERAAAPLLWQTLQSCGAALTAKLPESPASIIDSARVVLEQAGFIVDYLELRELSTLQLVDRVDQNCALFVAARLGDTRLIDNIQLAANN